MTDRKAIASGLWTTEAPSRLIAGRRRRDGALLFPLPTNDPDFEAVTLPADGTLWSWTIQSFRPKSPPYDGPDAFEPYGVGYVQLGDQLIVEGRLTVVDTLEIGMAMTTAIVAFDQDRLTFAFAPKDVA